MVSSSLIGVIAQRLVRIICPECKEEFTPDQKQIKELGLEGRKEKISFYRGKGCQYCMQTTYRGRTGVFEIMKVSDKIRDLILQKQPASKIRDVAISEGMALLKDAAVNKVIHGITTVEEIKRVIFTLET